MRNHGFCWLFLSNLEWNLNWNIKHEKIKYKFAYKFTYIYRGSWTDWRRQWCWSSLRMTIAATWQKNLRKKILVLSVACVSVRAHVIRMMLPGVIFHLYTIWAPFPYMEWPPQDFKFIAVCCQHFLTIKRTVAGEWIIYLCRCWLFNMLFKGRIFPGAGKSYVAAAWSSYSSKVFLTLRRAASFDSFNIVG